MFRFSSNVSAWAHMHGTWDFTKFIMAPLGMLVLTLDKADVRPMLADHARPGYYLGPSLRHHRCHLVYVIDTAHVRVSDSVSWHPHSQLLLPFNSPTQTLMEDLSRLTDSLNAYASLTPTAQGALRLSDTATTQLLNAITLIRNTFSPQPLPLPALLFLFLFINLHFRPNGQGKI